MKESTSIGRERPNQTHRCTQLSRSSSSCFCIPHPEIFGDSIQERRHRRRSTILILEREHDADNDEVTNSANLLSTFTLYSYRMQRAIIIFLEESTMHPPLRKTSISFPRSVQESPAIEFLVKSFVLIESTSAWEVWPFSSSRKVTDPFCTGGETSFRNNIGVTIGAKIS